MNRNSIDLKSQNAIYELVRQTINPELNDHTVLKLNHEALGLLSPKFKELILQDLQPYLTETKPYLNLQTDDWESMAVLLQKTVKHWNNQHFFEGWRDELFDVKAGEKVLFQLERAAFRPLGFKSHAVHLNAWFKDDNGLINHWIAKRSSHKAVCPNMFDNIACGGMSAGEEPMQSILRESLEEAGVYFNKANLMAPPGTFFSYRQVHRGVHREFLHIFNYQIEANFQPSNLDGEVSYFALMQHQEIIEHILNQQFMPDSIISLLHLWHELGFLEPSGKLVTWLTSLNINHLKI